MLKYYRIKAGYWLRYERHCLDALLNLRIPLTFREYKAIKPLIIHTGERVMVTHYDNFNVR